MAVLFFAFWIVGVGPSFAAAPVNPHAAGWIERFSMGIGPGPLSLTYESSAQDHSLPISDFGILPDGRGFIADAGAGRLLVLSRQGSVETEIPFPESTLRRLEVPPRERPAPRFFTVSLSEPTGEAFLIDLSSGEVHIFDTKSWKRVRGFEVSRFAVSPKSLVVLPNGEIRLHDPGKGKVFLLSASGQLLGATRPGRPSLVTVPGQDSSGVGVAVPKVAGSKTVVLGDRELVALGDSTRDTVELLAVDVYGSEPPRRLGTLPRAREGSDLHLLPHPADAGRFAFVEAGPHGEDPIRLTLCRFNSALGGTFEASPVQVIPPPPQRDLVPLLPFRLNAAGELVTFGQPDGGKNLQIVTLSLAWPR